VCDVAYSIQVEALERMALAELSLAPHLPEGAQLTTPDMAVTEFEEWLLSEPAETTADPANVELANLIRGK
jgi:hypothetical protein